MDDLKLISLVQKHEFIFNKKMPAFKSIPRKQRAWENIAVEMDATAEACLKRWTCLRDRFTRECKHQFTPGKSFTPSSWHLFDSMKFLKPYVQPRKGRNSSGYLEKMDHFKNETLYEFLDEELINMPHCANEVSQAPPSRSPSPSSCPEEPVFLKRLRRKLSPEDSRHEQSVYLKRAKRNESSSMDVVFLEAAKCFQKYYENQMATANPAIEAFGRMITATVEEMSASKQTRAIKLVTNLVMQIKEESE